jgi:hypothetical protein
VPADPSRLRQSLLEAQRQYKGQLELLLEERGPLIRGSFGTRARICGNPTCRCTRGELHGSKYLTATDHGKVRQVHVPAGDEVKVAAGVERYRRFRESKARLGALHERQLELVDALGRSLLLAYPPNNPLPPAARRGRRPKQDGGSTRR